MTDTTKPAINAWKQKIIRLPLKTVVSILAIVLSVAGCVWVFYTPWRVSRKPMVSLEDILDRTRKTSSLCIMKVFAKGAGVHSENEDSIWPTKVRGWTADNVIDIIIDLSKVIKENFELGIINVGVAKLTITLPPPEFDEKTFSYNPKNSYLAVDHGKISEAEFRNWSADCFGKIKDRISETVRQSDVLKVAREPARAGVKAFFMNMGIHEVVVRFDDEVSETSGNSNPAPSSGDMGNSKE